MLGINSHWNTEAAILSARLWMCQMRFLYGFGKWKFDDTAACQQIYDLVIANIRSLLVEVGLHDAELTPSSKKLNDMVEVITDMACRNRTSACKSTRIHTAG